MRKQALYALAFAIVAIIIYAYGMVSYDWYTEEREQPLVDEDGVLKSDIGYGLRGVNNHTRHRFNGTTLDEEEKVQGYDDFIGTKDTKASGVASTMNIMMIIALVMMVLFLPLVYLSSGGGLEQRFGKIGPYIPLLVAQIAALLLIIGPMWFSYAFITALDDDIGKVTGEPSQALGGMTGFWVIVGGIFIQVGALMALSRTRLIYIEPLDEVKQPKPLE